MTGLQRIKSGIVLSQVHWPHTGILLAQSEVPTPTLLHAIASWMAPQPHDLSVSLALPLWPLLDLPACLINIMSPLAVSF